MDKQGEKAHFRQERPILRMEIETQDGTRHTATINSTFQLPDCPETAQQYRQQITTDLARFFGARRVTLLSLDLITTLHLEVGA